MQSNSVFESIKGVMQGFDDETKAVKYAKSDYVCSIKFTKKNVYSTKNNPLCGITFMKWLMILWNYAKFIEWCYYPRALFITALSIVNTFLCIIEHILYWDQIQNVILPDDPVFIVGHPRTGTTLLHNLLSSDDENFFYCNTFCAGFPSSFLHFERFGSYFLSGIIEKTRPMDSMPLHFNLPQEDECGSNVLSGGLSYYMPLWFMKQEKDFRKYLDFDQRDGGDYCDERKWCEAFLYLLKKLCLRHNFRSKKSSKSSHKALCRLLLKSPIHTARIPLLRKLFPRAKFLYIHRDPDEVFCSAVHMADTAYWFCYLNTPSNEQITEFILWQFEQLWVKYDKAVNTNIWTCDRLTESDKKQNKTPKQSPIQNEIVSWDMIVVENVSDRCVTDDVIEISYTDLTTKMTETVERIYDFLDLNLGKKRRKEFMRSEADLKAYRRGVYTPLDEKLKMILRQRWKGYYDAFHYK